MTSGEPIRVAVVGLGAVGRAAMTLVAQDPELKLVAGVDIVAGKIDAVRGSVADDVLLTDDVETLANVQVAIVCTGPHFDRIAPTIRQLIFKKIHVVSDCAEMTWPWLKHPHLSDVIAGDARKAGVALVGAGAFPGVLSASLPLMLASTTANVKRVSVRRSVDLKTCRPSVRLRAGLNLTSQRFRPLAVEGKVGLAGLGESVTLIAQGLGRHPRQADVRRVVKPSISEVPADSSEPGRVIGVQQSAGYSDENFDIELTVTMASGPAETGDVIEVVGDRTIRIELPPTSDEAAAAVLANVARILPRVPPGLRTALDLPVIGSR